MSRYQSRRDVAEKAEWEGGPMELVFGYGLEEDELPEEDTELRDALRAVKAAEDAIHAFERMLYDALEV